MLMWIISAVVIGLIAGLIARALHPGNDGMSWPATIGLGILGSVLATFLGRMLGMYQPGQSAGFIASIIGAVVVLAIYSMMKRKRMM